MEGNFVVQCIVVATLDFLWVHSCFVTIMLVVLRMERVGQVVLPTGRVEPRPNADRPQTVTQGVSNFPSQTFSFICFSFKFSQKGDVSLGIFRSICLSEGSLSWAKGWLSQTGTQRWSGAFLLFHFFPHFVVGYLNFDGSGRNKDILRWIKSFHQAIL